MLAMTVATQPASSLQAARRSVVAGLQKRP
jgi:hypothetical protein